MSCEYEKEKQKGSGNDRERLGFQFLLARMSHFPTEQHSNCLDRKVPKPHLSLYKLVLRYRVKTSPHHTHLLFPSGSANFQWSLKWYLNFMRNIWSALKKTEKGISIWDLVRWSWTLPVSTHNAINYALENDINWRKYWPFPLVAFEQV